MQTLAIVGNGRTRTLAPHDDPTRVIWTMNNHAMLWERRTDAVFELHDDVLETTRYDDAYKAWLRKRQTFPIYMLTPNDFIPSSVRFPLSEIWQAFGRRLLKGDGAVMDFYTSTIPYMIALAMYKGFERIELYGIELDKLEEWAHHRDSVFFWLGKATALGVDVWIPEESVLYRESVYPINHELLRPSLKPIG